MTAAIRRLSLALLAVITPFALASQALAQASESVVHLKSTVQTVIRGEINNTRTPVLRIKSGQTVRIDTISHAGAVADPVAYFGAAGIPADQVLKDVIDIGKASAANGWGGHVLTGPIYIEDAAPGDLLEIRIISVEPRVPYGVNSVGVGGAAPGMLTAGGPRIIKFNMERRSALVASGIEVPLAPFMGIMAVAPSPEDGGKTPSRPPGKFGGNMDINRLTAGTTLYLPVFNPGGLFYTGDAHAVQGDGEVSGTAIEASLTPTLQFIVHKGAGKALTWPIAEDSQNFYIMGMDQKLDVALSNAIKETVSFLGRAAGLSPQEAYSLSSVGINFSIAEAVNLNLNVYGIVPKSYFSKPIEDWKK